MAELYVTTTYWTTAAAVSGIRFCCRTVKILRAGFSEIQTWVFWVLHKKKILPYHFKFGNFDTF